MVQKPILILVFLLSSLWARQSQPLASERLYDDFTRPWLDASKWLTLPTCSATIFLDTTASLNLLDCAREIQDNKLRLLVKAYGNAVSDEGRQFGPSELYFINPNAVNSIAATLRVNRVDAVACPSNSTASFGQTILGGNYFNPATGDPNDDVAAILIVEHAAIDTAGTLNVGALVFSPNAFYGFSHLGTIQFHELLTAKVQWDQPNHRFVFTVASASLRSTDSIYYSVPDTMPAVGAIKLLAARAFAPNCTTEHTTADIEVLFDKVAINE